MTTCHDPCAMLSLTPRSIGRHIPIRRGYERGDWRADHLVKLIAKWNRDQIAKDARRVCGFSRTPPTSADARVPARRPSLVFVCVRALNRNRGIHAIGAARPKTASNRFMATVSRSEDGKPQELFLNTISRATK
jgi:hypothetical protein